jgi:hypothetical protein
LHCYYSYFRSSDALRSKCIPRLPCTVVCYQPPLFPLHRLWKPMARLRQRLPRRPRLSTFLSQLHLSIESKAASTNTIGTPSSRPLRALQPIILSSRRLQLQTGRGIEDATWPKQEWTVRVYLLQMFCSSVTFYRTFYAHRWLNGVAKEGTTADFKLYWTTLLKDTK